MTPIDMSDVTKESIVVEKTKNSIEVSFFCLKLYVDTHEGQKISQIYSR